MFLYIKQNVNSLCRNLFTDFLQFYRRRKSVQVFLHIKKVEMYGIEIPISTYRTQGAITFKVLSLKHTEISTSRYFLCYKKNRLSWNLIQPKRLICASLYFFYATILLHPVFTVNSFFIFFCNSLNTLIFKPSQLPTWQKTGFKSRKSFYLKHLRKQAIHHYSELPVKHLNSVVLIF